MTTTRPPLAHPAAATLTALALLAGALAACVTPGQQREQLLIQTAREFNDDVRWGRYETAVSSLPPDEARLFLGRAELVDTELVIADQEVTTIKLGQPTTTATTLVRFDWYKKSDPVVRRTFIEQKWEWSGRWIVKKQRRTRGDRFPLVTEVAEKPAVAVDAGVAP